VRARALARTTRLYVYEMPRFLTAVLCANDTNLLRGLVLSAQVHTCLLRASVYGHNFTRLNPTVDKTSLA
jgi:hypothetical protein